MEIISHRGNLYGPEPDTENTPRAIYKALSRGYSVEIDVWSHEGKLWLGHDGPMEILTDHSLLTHPTIYVHAKNVPAIPVLNSIVGCQWFWHDTDSVTITSTGKIWCFPGVHLPNSIVLDLGAHRIFNIDHSWMGICTDYPNNF